MNHVEPADLLSVASGLRPSGDPRVRHVQRCPQCQAEVRRWQERLAPTLPPVWPTIEGFSLPARNRAWRRPAVAAAAAAAVVAVGWWWPKWVWGEASPWGPQAAWTLAAGKRVTLSRMAAPKGQVSLRLSPASGWALLSFRRLPPPGTRQLYEVWWIRGSRHIPAGVIRPQGSVGQVWLYSPAHFAGVQAVGITREPAPGRPTPTGPREFFATLAANA